MAVLISIKDLTHSFSHRPLYRNLSFSLETGEKCGLIGPNGAGKSTLFKILTGSMYPDSGEVSYNKSTRISYLEQSPTLDDGDTIYEAIIKKQKDKDDWEVQARAHELISLFNLDQFGDTKKAGDLSGGWKKRVALAREIVVKPDLLLLDEPTNHLDIESILWLEDWIKREKFATLTISHDRAFLSQVSERILEVNKVYKDGIFSKKGTLEEFLAAKQVMIEGQIAQETTLKNTLRRETEWLRQGAKARTTKQQARINRAYTLMDTVQDLKERNLNQSTKLEFQDSDQQSKKLIEAKKVSLAYDGKVLFENLNLLIKAGSRIGLIGRNGAGKSSLLKVLLKKEEPTSGTIYQSETLEVAYYDQKREELDPEISLIKTLCPLGEFVDFQDRKMHIRGYLDRFLFTNEQMELPVKKLSGGEQSRLLLGKLMLEPANLIILDEPTNDLDFPTLQLLEDCLDEFSGAAIIVSHDRSFLERTCDQFIAFSPTRHGVTEMFSTLSQWREWFNEEYKKSITSKTTSSPSNASPTPSTPAKAKKVSFKDKHEWETIEGKIKDAEALVQKLTKESEKPDVISKASECARIMGELSKAQNDLERLYARWEELAELMQ